MAAWDHTNLSSSAESICHSFASLPRERYFQHSKIKFVSLRGEYPLFLHDGTVSSTV